MRRLIFLMVVGIAGLAVLLSLGIWQMQRLAWKQDILATIDDRIAAEPVDLPTEPNPISDKYRPVQVVGEFALGELHVLTSVKNSGPGYRVIAPFVTNDMRRILIDRGYIRAAAKEADRSVGTAELVGNLHWPDEIDGYTPAADTKANIWYARDVAKMAAELETLPIMVVVRENSGTDNSILPMPVDTTSIPNNHLQYAITWFSLAFVWAAMTAYFLWRSRAKSES